MKIPFPLELSENEALFDWVAGKVALCFLLNFQATVLLTARIKSGVN